MVKSVGQVGLPPINANTLGYQGSPLPYVPIVTASRDPTGADVNYPTGCEWSNGLTLDGWKLFGFVDGVAQWRMAASGGGGGGIQTLSDDFGTKASPDGTGDIQQLGSAGIATLAGATSINFSLVGGGVANQYINVDAATAPGVDPVTPDGGGNMNFTGGQVAPLTVGANVIRTHTGALNTIEFEIQQTDSAAAKDTTKNGVSHFNSAQFTTDEGFISLVGGSVTPAFAGVAVDTSTPPGTNPVVADGSGVLTVTGDQVAAGTVGANVIRTDSLAANTITVEIQRSEAVAAPDSASNGVAHFDSAFFNVDAAGFVQLATSTSGVTEVQVDAFTPPGTNPVLPDVMGQMTVNGSLVSAGTTPIQTISLAANTYAVEVQTSQDTATTDVSRNGLAHFYDNDFIVDANGFVTLKNPPNNNDLRTFDIDVTDDFAPPKTLIYNPDRAFQINRANAPSITTLIEIPDHPGYYRNWENGSIGIGTAYYVTTTTFSNASGFALAPNGVSQIEMVQQFLSNPQSVGHTTDSWNLGYMANGGEFTPINNGNRYCCFTLSYNSMTGFVNLYARFGTTSSSIYYDLGVVADQNWHNYSIKIDSAIPNTAEFYLDDVLLGTFTDANINGMCTILGINCNFGGVIVAFDLYRYRFTGYGTRY